jgi:hypothetical protein
MFHVKHSLTGERTMFHGVCLVSKNLQLRVFHAKLGFGTQALSGMFHVKHPGVVVECYSPGPGSLSDQAWRTSEA